MKISKIVMMKDLNTGENKKVKIDTKEIREFNFPKKAYIINKVFIDNTWLKITLLVWVLVLSALLVLAKNSENYGFLSILILISLITITIVANFQIARLYFFSEEENRNIEKRLLIRWVWASTEGIELPKNTEAEERCYDFLKKVFEEINKFAIRFYFSYLAFALTLLLMATMLLIAESQPDEKASISIFVVVAWIFTEFYLWKIRCFIRAKEKMHYNVATRVNDGNGNTSFFFSLNGNYAIEEKISLIFKDCAF